MRKIMMTGSEFNEDNDLFFYEQDGKYYEMKDGRIKEISKLQLSIFVSLYWSRSSIKIEIMEKDNHFYSKMFIPIYEDIFLELYEEGKTEKEARNKVQNMFDEFIEYNEKYEENIRRNEINQIKKMHRFVFLPLDRENMKDDLSDLELIYVDDENTLDFRDLAILYGVPNDARADQPIFGYVEEGKLVFFKKYFMKEQFEKYKEIINQYKNEITEHYGLKEYDLYFGMQKHEDYLNKKELPLLDEYVTSDFIAYYPKYKQKNF